MFRVYVGNLPYRVRQSDLAYFFGKAGAVKEAMVPLSPDGRSKGFGFVEFEDEAGFKKALEMNGEEMDGRPLRINEARPREDRDGGNGGSRPAPAATEEKDAEEPSTDEE
jgi:cold-inducible RNA-binding protein